METGGRQLKRRCDDGGGGGAKRSKRFEKYPIIDDSDNFSNLNDDCLLEICSYLDVAGLENLTTANQRINVVSRKVLEDTRVEKVGILEEPKSGRYILTISQEDKPTDKDMCYEILASGEERRIHTDENLWSSPKIDPRTIATLNRPIPSFVFDRLREIMSRVQPRMLRIKAVQLDEKSLDKFEEIFGRTLHARLDFSGIRFGTANVGEEEDGERHHIAKRFTQWIISIRPQRISLWDMDMDSCNAIDADFFKKLADAVDLPTLNITDFLFRDQLTLLPSNEELEKSMMKFRSMKVEFLIVRTERIMGIVLERFQTNRYGFWQFGTTRKFEKSDILAAARDEYSVDEFTDDRGDCTFTIKKDLAGGYFDRELRISVDHETSRNGAAEAYSVRIFFY